MLKSLTIRGFTASDIYRDGFRVDGGRHLDLPIRQCAGVQVLKGSGAMIYGFSEPGGIVTYTTRQPLDAPYYSVETSSSVPSATTAPSIDATGPLNADKSLLYRIDMSYQNNGAPWGSSSRFHLRREYISFACSQVEHRRGELGEARGRLSL